MRKLTLAAFIAASLTTPVLAAPDDFAPGPLIESYGPVVQPAGATPIPADTRFRVAFDAVDRAEEGELNRKFTSAARFLNMHAAAGVPADNMELALVIHGGAVHDVTSDAAGPNADLVATLLAHNVRIIVCGQSASYQDVTADDLLPGVEMALSAMTAHALLQADGYTVNPF
ncbi:DsrE family protein [Maricaulis sp. CAU 1757]